MKPVAIQGFDLAPGTMLGKYEIITKLAMGGMAEIYLARMSGTAGFEKMLVIKRILPTVASDPKFVQMFLDEARLAATLRHPNISDVYEVGEHGGAPFFAMEFVHGQDTRALRMASRERKEPVPLSIASALDYAHERTDAEGKNLGLVHRDVSTSNILISYEGAIKLIDFGIARATSSTHKTQTGTLKGKIPYMSPEQCRGQHLDRRSDLFSLGTVLYELTVGQRPFRGETDFAIMDQIVYKGAEPPSRIVRDYPMDLEAIVMRLLAHKPENRYQTADEMLQDLDPFITTHRLFVSAKPLSRYMRLLFNEQIVAWDKAIEDGNTVNFTRHTATGSEALMTPPSGFPVMAPLSEQMAAIDPSFERASRPSSEFAVPTRPSSRPGELAVSRPTPRPGELMAQARPGSAPVFRDSRPLLVPDEPVLPPAPEIKLRRRGWVFAVFAIVFAGGGLLAYLIVNDAKSDGVPASLVATATPPVIATPPPAPPPPPPKKEIAPAKPEPEIKEPAVAPEPPPPVPEPKTVPKRPPPPKQLVKRPPTPPRPPPKEVAKAPPKEVPKEVPKEPPKDVKPKDPPKDPNKDPTWKEKPGDSPFLP